MKRMIWTNELSIGNLNIDNDHKKLIEVIDNLIELVESDYKREKFAEILSKMTDYVFIHLKKEETYMSKFNYPKLQEHIKHHRDYVYKVAVYNTELLGNNPPDPKEIIEYIESWWENHIVNLDKDYEVYREAVGSHVRYPKF